MYCKNTSVMSILHLTSWLISAHFSYAVTTGSQLRQSFISQTRSINPNRTHSESVLHEQTSIMTSLVYRTPSLVTASPCCQERSRDELTSIHLLLETPSLNSTEEDLSDRASLSACMVPIGITIVLSIVSTTLLTTAVNIIVFCTIHQRRHKKHRERAESRSQERVGPESIMSELDGVDVGSQLDVHTYETMSQVSLNFQRGAIPVSILTSENVAYSLPAPRWVKEPMQYLPLLYAYLYHA